MGSELKQCRVMLIEVHGAPSRDGTTVLELATTPSMNGTKKEVKGGTKIKAHHLPLRIQKQLGR